MLYRQHLAFYPKCRRFAAWSLAERFLGGISDKTLLNGASVALFNQCATYSAFPGGGATPFFPVEALDWRYGRRVAGVVDENGA